MPNDNFKKEVISQTNRIMVYLGDYNQTLQDAGFCDADILNITDSVLIGLILNRTNLGSQLTGSDYRDQAQIFLKTLTTAFNQFALELDLKNMKGGS
jgi:hypothetical protein